MIILDGKKLSEKILERLRRKIQNRHLNLSLAAILIGDNPISEVFLRQKERICQKAGVGFRLFKFSEKISAKKLKEEIKQIVLDPDNSGIIIQLPLPPKFNTQEILNLIPPEKDIDVLSEKSLGKLYTGTSEILPPVVSGISKLLKEYKIPVKGKNVVVVGAGKLVGQPLILWLLREKATVSVINEFTKNVSSIIKKADILISGVGKANLIKGNMIKRGVVIIDAGTSVEKGKLVGDVDFKSVSKKASYITPVPGGVGPMTIAGLLENLIILNKK
jgi:methylenetetrahydrofolate dehydrogenase (NADP+)/methenyltetrahydrofolate cyclohydrolase